MRFKITVRGDDTELRGRMDVANMDTLGVFANMMEPFGLVVASPADDDYDPFGISEPDFPPTLEGSREVIGAMMENASDSADLLDMLATIHCAQAVVIRGERYQRERAEAELRDRELHHFEVEQENARLEYDNAKLLAVIEHIKAARSNHPECEKHPDDDTVTCGWKSAVMDIDRALL